MKAQAGDLKFPAANHYPVKRLYDEGSLTSRNTDRRYQTVDGYTDRSNSPQRCTFGIPYDAYRNVIIGSQAFLDGKNYNKGLKTVRSKIPTNTTAGKQRILLDGKKNKSPDPGQYEATSSLKSPRFTFGKALSK